MLTHQVYFWLKDPGNNQSFDQLKKGLESLLNIDSMKSGHIGVPAATPDREVVDHSYTFAYYTTFETLEDHEVYQTHPIHLAFVESCAHLWERVQIYDYSSMN